MPDLRAAVAQACTEMADQISLKEVRRRCEEILGRSLVDDKLLIKDYVADIVDGRSKVDTAVKSPVGTGVTTASGRLSLRPTANFGFTGDRAFDRSRKCLLNCALCVCVCVRVCALCRS